MDSKHRKGTIRLAIAACALDCKDSCWSLCGFQATVPGFESHSGGYCSIGLAGSCASQTRRQFLFQGYPLESYAALGTVGLGHLPGDWGCAPRPNACDGHREAWRNHRCAKSVDFLARPFCPSFQCLHQTGASTRGPFFLHKHICIFVYTGHLQKCQTRPPNIPESPRRGAPEGRLFC